ncbi:MAG: phosphoribosylanthranilate isomerase [Sphingomonadaceae bacterium]
MPVQAKICGISTPEALDAAVRGGASHIGFVFFPKSPRNVAPDAARALALRAPAHVGKVGLFVDPDPAFVAATLAVTPLDVLQLHGSESPVLAAALAAAHGREIWKAIPVRTRADLTAASGYRGAVQRLVYDAKPPKGADLPGGNGLRFDWKLLEGFAHSLPWLLSGGLDAANVANAVGVTGARAVDISSGVESAPGVKDVDKIAAFLQAVGAL